MSRPEKSIRQYFYERGGGMVGTLNEINQTHLLRKFPRCDVTAGQVCQARCNPLRKIASISLSRQRRYERLKRSKYRFENQHKHLRPVETPYLKNLVLKFCLRHRQEEILGSTNKLPTLITSYETQVVRD
uniref:Uncharacterized protein n=1 Tax=Timema bartmani TaxID=61472 RepID=A0A7R9I402_9NEOP|nr:unnamed protein product [Timema bartmani]